jgi:hypothetical protein
LPSLSEGSHREPSDWAIVVGRSRRVDQRERLPVGVLLGPGAAAGARRPDRMVAAPLTRDARDYVRPPGQVVRGRAVGLRFQNRRQSVTHYLLTRRLHGTDEGYGPVRLRPEFNGARPRGLEPRQQPCDRRACRATCWKAATRRTRAAQSPRRTMWWGLSTIRTCAAF